MLVLPHEHKLGSRKGASKRFSESVHISSRRSKMTRDLYFIPGMWMTPFLFFLFLMQFSLQYYERQAIFHSREQLICIPGGTSMFIRRYIRKIQWLPWLPSS